jgi:hypothetical protein
MSDFEAAVERAQSRAAVLQSLQNAYGGTTGTTVSVKSAKGKGTGKPVDQKKPESSAGSSDKGLVGDIVECLLASIGDQTVKTRTFFRDSLRGKAIVVENLKAQVEASKASKKIERLLNIHSTGCYGSKLMRAKVYVAHQCSLIRANKRKHTMSNRAMKRRHVADPQQLPSAGGSMPHRWSRAATARRSCKHGKHSGSLDF